MSQTPEDSTKSAAGKRINWDLTLKIVGAIVGIATLGFGMYQFVVKPKRDREVVIYNNKQELYNKAMESTSAFASASTQAEADQARKQFWELYYGKLSAFENQDVKQAMQTFGGALKQWEEFNDPSDFTKPAEFDYVPEGETKSVSFRDLSYRLTQACSRDLNK